MLSSSLGKADEVAAFLSGLAHDVGREIRLGNKEELRAQCGVSVGTFNEGIKLAHASGAIVLRRGPGGGIFAARRTALQSMAQDLLAAETASPPAPEVRRLHGALYPLVIEDALTNSSTADIAALREQINRTQGALASHDLATAWHTSHQFQASLAAFSTNTILRAAFVGLIQILEEDTTWSRSYDRGLLVLQEQLNHQTELTSALESRDRTTALSLAQPT